MRASGKLGVEFYFFIIVCLTFSAIIGILSIYLIVKNSFELYYFTPLLLDLIISSIFVSIAYYLSNQVLDVKNNTEVLVITLRGGKEYTIYMKHFKTYIDKMTYIEIVYNENKRLKIYKNPSYWNDSTKRLLSILEKTPQN